MEIFFPPFPIVSQPANPDEEYDYFGIATDGLQITNSNGANALSGWVTLGTTNFALSGLRLQVGQFSATTVRFQIHLRINGTTTIVPGFHVQGAAAEHHMLFIPIKIPSGALVEAAVRMSSNGASLYMAAVGVKALSTVAPGFDTMADISGVVTASVRPDATGVPNTGVWTPLGTLASPAGALLIGVGDNGTAPATGYRATLHIGVGASGSEVEIHRQLLNVQISAPYVYTPKGVLVRKALANGATISAKIVATTPNSDNLLVACMAFY